MLSTHSTTEFGPTTPHSLSVITAGTIDSVAVDDMPEEPVGTRNWRGGGGGSANPSHLIHPNPTWYELRDPN